jgi:probable F420-dependent oxidoreductase
MKVRIGLGLGTVTSLDAALFAALVDACEALGFDSLWLSERLTGPGPDPLVALSVAAGRTERLKLGTSVLVVPGRNPVVLAKELASLDRLSEGRLLLAVGLGVRDPAEQAAFGVDPAERGPWLDEALPLLRRLWRGEAVDHDGPRFRYRGVRLELRPVQQPPDVWLGGRSRAELARAGRLGDGWLASFCTPAEAGLGRQAVEAAAARAGRQVDPEHFGAVLTLAAGPLPEPLRRALATRRPEVEPETLVATGASALVERIEAFVEAGISKFVVVPLGGADPTGLERLASAVLPLQGVLGRA